jgi:hypothetical protein
MLLYAGIKLDLSITEEQGLRVFDNRMPRISGPYCSPFYPGWKRALGNTRAYHI